MCAGTMQVRQEKWPKLQKAWEEGKIAYFNYRELKVIDKPPKPLAPRPERVNRTPPQHRISPHHGTPPQRRTPSHLTHRADASATPMYNNQSTRSKDMLSTSSQPRSVTPPPGGFPGLPRSPPASSDAGGATGGSLHPDPQAPQGVWALRGQGTPPRSSQSGARSSPSPPNTRSGAHKGGRR